MRPVSKGEPWTSTTSVVELFAKLTNSWKPLTNAIKSSTVDVTGVLDPPLPLFRRGLSARYSIKACDMK